MKTFSPPRTHSTKPRCGSTLAELIVAAGLLVTCVSLLSTGNVATFKLQRMEHQLTVGTDELANQMERILPLSPAAAANAIAHLEISSWAHQTLPTAKLDGQLIDDEHGTRVVLKLQWQRTGDSRPLVAVGWLNSAMAEPSIQQPVLTGDSDEA